MPNGANITPDQIIPIWYEFYHNLSQERISHTTVQFSPIIDVKPVDMATMCTTMQACKDMSIALGQHHSFQTIDQQLYSFAQQLKWAFPDELPQVEICPATNIPIFDHLLHTLHILHLVEKVTVFFIYRPNNAWFNISLLLTNKTMPDGLHYTQLTCRTSHTKFEAPLKLDILFGVRFGGVSMGSRATRAQRKQSPEMQREAVV